MFWREIKLWVLLLYSDLIGRLGVTDKSEGSKWIYWVSGIITVSRFPTKLSETEDVQSIGVFLTKLQLSSKSLVSCRSFCFILWSLSTSSIWSLAVTPESNSFKLSVDHTLSQIYDLDRCTNIFSIVAFYLLTVLMYDILAIILSAIVKM